MSFSLDGLPAKDRQEILDIQSGLILPPLHSDVIAKHIFNADVHPDRLNFLMRSISKDNTIEVRSSAGNESFRQSYYSKGMIYDIPSWLKDNRAADLEVQKAKQNYLFIRTDLYASDMLLLQYSVVDGQKKTEMDYSKVEEAILIVLMLESPDVFRDYDKKSDRYIHRFTRMTADTGLSYPSKAKTIYVQLDKCLAQFKDNKNAESMDGKPDRLQKWLVTIADINDSTVASMAESDEELQAIRKETYEMGQDKEVLNMLIQERYDRMDWLTYGNQRASEGEAIGEARGEARGEAKATRALIEQMLQKGRTPAQIQEFCGYPIEKVLAIQREWRENP